MERSTRYRGWRVSSRAISAPVSAFRSSSSTSGCPPPPPTSACAKQESRNAGESPCSTRQQRRKSCKAISTPRARRRQLVAKSAAPDAEQLLGKLAAQMRPLVAPQTGLIGIVTGGAWVAERLHRELGLEVPFGTLDISFYRDDFQRKGLKHKVE